MGHVFERAGLGVAPFRFVRFEVRKFKAAPDAPIQPGASCDYCSTGIMDCYVLQGSGPRDKTFVVGCECVKKTGDRGLIDIVKKQAAQVRRERAHESLAARIVAAKAWLATPESFDSLKAFPHPHEYHASQGRSRHDWACWMLDYAGTAGKTQAVRFVESHMR